MSANQTIIIDYPRLTLEKLSLTEQPLLCRACASADILEVKEGTATAKTGGIAYCLAEGDIMLLPGMDYTISAESGSARVNKIRLQDFLYSGHKSGEWPFSREESILQGQSAGRVARLLEIMEEEYFDKQADRPAALSNITAYLIILLERASGAECAESPDPAESVKNYIENNYRSNITLAALSETFFISPFHISHIFKEKYSVSPIRYLLNVRINAAKKLLVSTNKPIAEIAAEVGYANANYFQILFKRFTGMSPGAFRKQRAE